MRRLILALAACAALLCTASPAQAAFGLKDLDVFLGAQDGSPSVQAGSHPFSLTTSLAVNTLVDPETSEVIPDEGEPKDVKIVFPAGFAGNPTAVPRCSAAQFISGGAITNCPDASAVGTARIVFGELDSINILPVFNLAPAFGQAARIGFNVEGIAPVVVDIGLSESPPYNIVATSANTSQAVFFLAAEVTTWGVPSSALHDDDRGGCMRVLVDGCSVSIPETPFITLPTSCEEPLTFGFEADSWQDPSPPGVPYPFQDFVTAHDNSTPPNPLAPSGCAKLEFSPSISAAPTSKAASSPTGLDFSLDVKDEGISNPDGLAASTIKKAVVTLPEGMSANPSLAEGLNVCTEAQLDKETASSEAGSGCPNASKIGTVEVETPLLEDQVLRGSLFIAKPYENPFDSLLAMYLVIQDRKLGISVKQPLEVIPDPVTGQLTTVAEELPQLPFSHFRLHFREGARSPLATSSTCGTHTVKAVLTPYSGDPPLTTTSAFQIITGPNEGPCPKGGLPPFKPGLLAGTVNNRAGYFSPFNVRISRNRLRTRDHPLLDQAAAGDHRQAGGRPLLPRRGDPRGQGTHWPAGRPRRAGRPILPGGIGGGPLPRRLGSRPRPHLRPRQGLPRRPI